MSQIRIAPVIALALLSPTAWANVGIPMRELASPAYWIAFLPVVFIEAGFIHRMLGQSCRHALKSLAFANFVSTSIGIAVVWGMLLILEFGVGSTILSGELTNSVAIFPMTILGAPWIHDSNGTWSACWSFLILAVSFCVASILIEYRMLRQRFSGVAHSDVLRSLVYANIASYALVCALAIPFPLKV